MIELILNDKFADYICEKSYDNVCSELEQKIKEESNYWDYFPDDIDNQLDVLGDQLNNI